MARYPHVNPLTVPLSPVMVLCACQLPRMITIKVECWFWWKLLHPELSSNPVCRVPLYTLK
ncbi:uncharacterized protein DS421_11g327690 [Arachis hypogaea]|nr:uncharacterized protein DS421_11g327690 [Arachis hypogaea]